MVKNDLKNFFFLIKMITLDQLKVLAKENNMKCSYMNKDEIIELLLDEQIITTSDLRHPTVV